MWTFIKIFVELVVAVWIDSDDICVALLWGGRRMWWL